MPNHATIAIEGLLYRQEGKAPVSTCPDDEPSLLLEAELYPEGHIMLSMRLGPYIEPCRGDRMLITWRDLADAVARLRPLQDTDRRGI